jgi:hypothetical protein
MNMSTKTGSEALEPIIVVWADGRRTTLNPDLTRRIWEAVKKGWYSGPQELVEQALDWYSSPHELGKE